MNPVQTTAWKMDAPTLKAEFDNSLGFWGAVDTQQTLPFGTSEEVRDDVKAKMQTLRHGGGYVITSCHTIREEVPPENVRALYESALEFGGYD
jgi:uroporphyrinogen decarboxylase